MVIVIEPMILVPGERGIQIEGIYVVTRDGCEVLTGGFPADPAPMDAQGLAAAANAVDATPRRASTARP